MNAAISQPAYYQTVDHADLSRQLTAEGTKFKVNYFQYNLTCCPSVVNPAKIELSDSELLMAAEKAGTFDFLNSPQEDIYNDVLKKPE